MDEIEAARMLKALGDPTRLRIFRYLDSCCPPGACDPSQDPCVGDICEIVKGDRRQTTAMSFHLKELRNAGLVETAKRGKNVCCSVDRPRFDSLIEFLQDKP